jgi:hypothetical protein
MTVLDKIKGKIVYLSYPMTGIKNYNKEYGELMYDIIKSAGARVILNPSILPAGLEHHQYMTIDLAMVEISDVLIMGEGWPDSSGCCQEFVKANDCNVDTVRFQDVLIAIESENEKAD